MSRFSETLESHFNALADAILSDTQAGEQIGLSLEAEETLYVRFNANRVRQNTDVDQAILTLRFHKDGKTCEHARTLSGDLEHDKTAAQAILAKVRSEARSLPADPHQVALLNNGTSREIFTGQLPSARELISDVSDAAQGSDLAGLYCGGSVVSANRNSLGQRHWFSTESFFLDYSLYNGNRAAKSVLSGPQWNREEWRENLSHTKNQLSLLSRPVQNIKPGKYRVYLAPGAVSEILGTVGWGGLSASGWKQGRCPFKKLADGEQRLSPMFTLKENFELGLAPRFNSLGEVAPTSITLIENGSFKEFLTSSRAAKEYGLNSNGANEQEMPRSPEILPGSLKQADVMKELGTGLYLSNLHYLNWSDPVAARITGMTRYACFWVEKGEIVGPIKDLRFDESLFDAFGGKLANLTAWSETDPSVSTYFARALGGKRIPGALIDDFTFTL